MTTSHRALAAGTVIFHPDRGYGVLTSVNLMTGWVSARFGSEHRALDLSLVSDGVRYADGEQIQFRRFAPAYMPHGRLISLVRQLHVEGYERLYLYAWPKPSGMHWRWHLFCGQRDWVHRPQRPGWSGSGASYIFDPVLGWGDAPGASTDALIAALRKFDPEGLAQAEGQDRAHTAWFARTADALGDDYAYSLGWDTLPNARRGMPRLVPVMPVRRHVPGYQGAPIEWPPGWLDGWAHHGYHRSLRARIRTAN
jgi:hypothetical protein